jgi:hypothetical protein
LCAELVDELYDYPYGEDLLQRARAALVEPEPINHWKEALIDALVVDFLLNEENRNDPKRAIHDIINWNMQLARDPLLAEGDGVGVTDEELIAFARSRSPWREWMESDGSLANAHFELAELLRAAISRYGTTHPRPIPNPAPVPGVDFPGPDGDWGGIQELCEAEGVDPAIGIPLLVRAREAWQLTHPRPIPVAERPWEREGFCDARGLCWWTVRTGEVWTLCRPSARATYGWMLPFFAIPLPAQEGADG